MSKYFLLLCMLLTSCSLFHQEYFIEPQGRSLSQDEKSELLNSLQLVDLPLKILAEQQLKHSDEQYQFRQYIKLTQQELVIESYPQNSFNLLSRLEVKNQSYNFYQLDGNLNQNGQVSDNLLEELFDLPFSLSEFRLLMLGNLPQIGVDLQAVQDGTDYIFYTNDQSYRFVLQKLEDEKIILKSYARYKLFGRGLKYSLEFSEFKKIAEYDLAARVAVHYPTYDLQIESKRQFRLISK